jgi:3-oxoacyl-[acyl-carrier protein] reductase
MNLNFSNKTILITGATRGIGKQIADDLYLLGATLILTGTKINEVEELNNIASKNDKRKTYFYLDLLKTESVNNFLKQMSTFERIDCLINNAGINRLNTINDIEIKDWNEMFSVNLSAPFSLIKEISNKMILNHYGRILNVASIFSKISKEKRSAYSATKFGLHGLTVGVSNDLAKHNILVNCISPGFILTDLTKKNLTKKDMDELVNQIPAKRLGTVQDISKVAIFLISDLNQYLTGQNIIVDGGFTNV